MRIGPIVLKLRLAETRFGNRIGGAADLVRVLENTFEKEVAFVVQLSETAPPNLYDNGLNQEITERFGVVVALDNGSSDRDKTGLTAYDTLHEVRSEIFRAILNWQMDGFESTVYYSGGRVVDINRANLWYMFEFEATTRITDSDGVDNGASELPDFDSVAAQYELMNWE